MVQWGRLTVSKGPHDHSLDMGQWHREGLVLPRVPCLNGTKWANGRLWHIAARLRGSTGPDASEVALPDEINLAHEGV